MSDCLLKDVLVAGRAVVPLRGNGVPENAAKSEREDKLKILKRIISWKPEVCKGLDVPGKTFSCKNLEEIDRGVDDLIVYGAVENAKN